jgi:hypothetical protein
MIFASPSRWIFDWNPAREIRVENLRDDDNQPRKLRRPNDPARRRKRRKRGRLVIVRFPALDQRFTQDLDDKHSYDNHHSAGDYDASEEVRDALRDLRSLGITNLQGGEAHPTPSESHLSGSSQGTSMIQESKPLEP